jgi:acyl-CoA synthetase (AMP-forming)/AMP-acid ligase II
MPDVSDLSADPLAVPSSVVLLHDAITVAAQQAPGRPAITDGRTGWTFSQLQEVVAIVAAGVCARTAHGDRVALLSHNSAAYVACYYAIPAAGRILVPLNQRLHPRQWADQLRRSDAELLLASKEFAGQLPAGLDLPVVVIGDDSDGGTRGLSELGELGELAAPVDLELLRRRTDPEAAAWLLFTSGTTGAPRGVPLSHRQLVAAIRSSAYLRPIAEDDVFATPFPLCHVAGVWVPTHHAVARPVVLLPRFSRAEMVAAIRSNAVTTVSLGPTMIDALLDGASEDDLAVLRRLRRVGYGSAAIPVPLLLRAREQLGCSFSQGYGMTELAGTVTTLSEEDHEVAVTSRPELLASAGRPAPGVVVRIVDEQERDVPVGSAGEVLIGGPHVGAGYWEDPEATAAVFTPAGLRTGDLGRLDAAGYLYLVDRIKELIISGGENVSARVVENVIRGISQVRDVAVIGLPDPRWGERVCAVVVPLSGTDRDGLREQIEAACRAELAGFEVPRRVEFVDVLPLGPTGKVAKPELRRRLLGQE